MIEKGNNEFFTDHQIVEKEENKNTFTIRITYFVFRGNFWRDRHNIQTKDKEYQNKDKREILRWVRAEIQKTKQYEQRLQKQKA